MTTPVDVEKELQQFSLQKGTRLGLRFVHAYDMPSMLRAADDGDKDAQSAAISIMRWEEMANDAVRNGGSPGCADCGCELERGRVAGFAMLIPLDASVEAIGLVAAYCDDCMKQDAYTLKRKLFDDIEDKFGNVLVDLH